MPIGRRTARSRQDRRAEAKRLLQRGLVFSVLGPLGVRCVKAGSPSLDRLLSPICVVSSWELATLVRAAGVESSPRRAAFWSLVLLRAPNPKGAAVATYAALADSLLGAGGRPRPRPTSLLVALAVAGPMRAIVRLRRKPRGEAWLLWGVTTTWLADAAAYLLGPRLGGPALPRWINARKSWSGYAAGGLLAGACGLAFSKRLNLTRRRGCALGATVGLSASLGDIAESVLKRRAGATDSGTLLPGYGGVLDRVDSLLTSAVCLLVLYEATQMPDGPHSTPRGRPSSLHGKEGEIMVAPAHLATTPSELAPPSSDDYGHLFATALGAFYALCVTVSFDRTLSYFRQNPIDFRWPFDAWSYRAQFAVLVFLVTYLLWVSMYFLYNVRLYMRLPRKPETIRVVGFASIAISLSVFYFLGSSIGPPNKFQVFLISLIIAADILLPLQALSTIASLRVRLYWIAKNVAELVLTSYILLFVSQSVMGNLLWVYALFALVLTQLLISPLELRLDARA